MVKKLKRAKSKSTKKQKAVEQPHPKSSTPGIKISEAILTLCEPLRKRYTDPQRTETIIWLTVMAWNVSLLPDDNQLDLQRSLIKTLPKELDGADVAVLFESFDELIKRKNKLYPDIREYILNHQISFSGDKVTLTVGAVPISEKTEDEGTVEKESI